MSDNWRFRVNWRGKLILQRKRKVRASMHFADCWELRWYDANATDLADFYKENKND